MTLDKTLRIGIISRRDEIPALLCKLLLPGVKPAWRCALAALHVRVFDI